MKILKTWLFIILSIIYLTWCSNTNVDDNHNDDNLSKYIELESFQDWGGNWNPSKQTWERINNN
jgi:hypothetical protein